MKNVGWAALIGAGVALVAFLIDWLADRLDTPEEAEPLWPASKPYSRTFDANETPGNGPMSLYDVDAWVKRKVPW